MAQRRGGNELYRSLGVKLCRKKGNCEVLAWMGPEMPKAHGEGRGVGDGGGRHGVDQSEWGEQRVKEREDQGGPWSQRSDAHCLLF